MSHYTTYEVLANGQHFCFHGGPNLSEAHVRRHAELWRGVTERDEFGDIGFPQDAVIAVVKLETDPNPDTTRWT